MVFECGRTDFLSKFRTNLIKSLYLEISECNSASWIVSLQRKRPFVQDSGEVFASLLIRRLVVFYDHFAVHNQSHLLILDDDLLSVPYAVFRSRFEDIFYRVQAAGPARIAVVGVVHLAFEAILWPAGLLELGMEVDTRVGIFLGFDLSLEVKILERLLVAHIE